MTPQRAGLRNSIWLFAIGYFVFYAPYSALAKSLSSSRLLAAHDGLSGFVILPATILASVVTVGAFITCLGWWRCAGPPGAPLARVPLPDRWTAISGLGTAAIIATTTLAYTFEGVSIVLALLLMRGGVLVLAPIVDSLFKRKVHWYSWTALALSLAAVSIALADRDSYLLNVAAVLNLALYLGGYVLRLQAMTRHAKRGDRHVTRRYFVQEQLVSLPVLVLVPGLIALFGDGEIAAALRTGFSTFLFGDQGWAALGIGVLYGCLFMFGTLIYLDHRENTFCIPVNRCSSLLSGLVASFALSALFDQPPVNASQLTGASLIGCALLVLTTASMRRRRAAPGTTLLPTRLVLFVCSGNTSRSPLAQAICRAELARYLGIDASQLEGAHLRIESAGLAPRAGAPMTPQALAALDGLDVPAHAHAARPIDERLARDAEIIFCMTEEQRTDLVARFGFAAAKTLRLDPHADLPDPSGQDEDAFHACASRVRDLIFGRLPELTRALA